MLKNENGDHENVPKITNPIKVKETYKFVDSKNKI